MNTNSQHSKLRVLCILPVLGQPRHAKRIKMLQEEGFEVEAVTFERDYLKGRLPECPVERLGTIGHGRYGRRILKSAQALPAVRQAIKRNDLVYAFGTDMAFLALVAGLGLGRAIVLEMGDIRDIQTSPGVKGRVVRKLDKFMVGKYSLLVATTSGFIDNYYRKWLGSSIGALVIENKLEASFADGHTEGTPASEGKPLVDRPLRIGYFGGLRCRWSYEVLEGLAKARPNDVEVIFAGHAFEPQDLAQRVEAYLNMKFVGPYKSPHDLPDLYRQVDLVWACYHPIGAHEWNLKWARPNRFYESCFFRTPLVSRSGSSDAVVVEQHQIGFIVSTDGIEQTVDALCGIRPEDLELWRARMETIPQSLYVYTSEAKDLARALRDIASGVCCKNNLQSGENDNETNTAKPQKRRDGVG